MFIDNRLKSLALIVTSLVILLQCVGCSEDFKPYYYLDKLRVLGIQADRPVLKPGEKTILRAITYTPPSNSGKTTYEWSWCPLRTRAADQYQCPIKRTQLIQILQQKFGTEIPFEQYIPSFQLGNSDTAVFTYPGEKSSVLGLCLAMVQAADVAREKYGFSLPTFDCSKQYDMSIRLVARNGSSEIVSVKRVGLWIGDSDVEINQNPQILNIQIRPKEIAHINELRKAGVTWIPNTDDPNRLWYSIPEDSQTTVIEGVPFEIRALIDKNSIETWTPPQRYGTDREPQPEKEVIQFSWFINLDVPLEFEQSRVYREGKTKLEDVSNTTWTPKCFPINQGGRGKTTAQCQDAIMWSFVRDGRLGLDWARRALNVIPSDRKINRGEKE